MNITGYTVEKIEDPFGILSGDRYEFFLDIVVDEEDELYSENGLKVKVLFIVDDKGARISHYNIMDSASDKVLDFDLEEDEEKLVEQFCKEHANDDEVDDEETV